ncbi:MULTISPECIES: AAA family ATPase [Prochlorococcus]|uniref:AAA family ATPase n=1 Tax=Prochlorococcus TaxID=1218 RepID=UPI001267A97A|nr:AAA family ATPase [Prochlorococcus marinus]
MLDKERLHSLENDAKHFAELVQAAKYLIEEKKPVFQRNDLLRAMAQDMKLPVSNTTIWKILATARREINGTSEGEDPEVELKVSPNKWLWEGLIQEGTLNLIVALPKVGKSSLIAAFLGAMARGESEYCGKKINSKARPIILGGTDQPLEDWAEILCPVGLMERTGKDTVKFLEPIMKAWHKGNPIHLTEEDIEKLYQYALQYPKSIFFMDAFASLIQGMGLDENHVDSVEPVRMLYEALAATDATIILLHHAGGTNSNERAVKASRGTTALPAEASTIINLAHLVPEDKTDNRVVLTTGGRNSKAIEMVVEQVERSCWVDLGSKAEINERQRLEKARSNLSERQNLVLTFVEERKEQHGLNTTSIDLVEKFGDEFGDDLTKALSSLKSLETKKLLKSRNGTLPEKGKVLFFYPPE